MAFKQQIFIASSPDFFPSTAFSMACQLAAAYNKDICFLGIAFNPKQKVDNFTSVFSSWVNLYANQCPNVHLDYHVMTPTEDFTSLIEATEASMLIFQLNDKVWPFNKPQRLLDICRQLRVPYFFVKEGQSISFDKILVPVGFLVEEREKGPFSNSFGRFFDSEILLFPAKDYGSRTQKNVEAIADLLTKSKAKFLSVPASSNSFKVELEAADSAASYSASLLMISASRDYGLDDILFGPKELKVIRKSSVPVMVINPRGDLYALCG